MDKLAFSKVSYGVYIATTKYEEKASGCVITTLMQITAEDTPKMMVAVNKSNYTERFLILRRSKRWKITKFYGIMR